MKTITFLAIIGFIVSLLLLSPAHAAADGSGSFMLGVAASPDYEGSNDHKALPVLSSRYTWKSGRYADLGGTHEAGRAFAFKANIIANSTWEFGPIVQYRLGRDGVEDSQVDDMRDIDDAIELGAFIGETRGNMYVGLSAVGDVSSEHSSFIVDLSGHHVKNVNQNFKVITGASVSYAGEGYSRTYFGVDSVDAASSGLPLYKESGDFKDMGLSITAKYTGAANWGIAGFMKYNLMLGDFADSPLVEDEGEKHQLSAGIAITHSY